MKTSALVFLCMVFIPCFASESMRQPYYFCTVANSRFFRPLINLIGSLHKHHYDDIGEILVFDLGLNKRQIAYLSNIKKVKVYPIEKTNPEMFKDFMTRFYGKPVPGWYSWKPVVIKQALDIYSEILYIDAGTTVLKRIDPIFEHIRSEGYFFHNGCSIPIRNQMTQYVIKKFDLESENRRWILDAQPRGLEAGFMGFTRSIYDSVVLPMYRLTFDIRNFQDDGSAVLGFGMARYEQTLFSIFAFLNNLYIHQHSEFDPFFLINTPCGKVKFGILYVGLQKESENSVHICCSREQINYAYYKRFVKFKD